MYGKEWRDHTAIAHSQLLGTIRMLTSAICETRSDTKAQANTKKLLYENVWLGYIKPHCNEDAVSYVESCHAAELKEIAGIELPKMDRPDIDEGLLEYYAGFVMSELKLNPAVNELIEKVMFRVYQVAAGVMSPNLTACAKAHSWTQRICGDLSAISPFENEDEYCKIIAKDGFCRYFEELLDEDFYCQRTAEKFSDYFNFAKIKESWWRDSEPGGLTWSAERFQERLDAATRFISSQYPYGKTSAYQPVSKAAKKAAEIATHCEKLSRILKLAKEDMEKFSDDPRTIAGLVAANFIIRFIDKQLDEIESDLEDLFQFSKTEKTESGTLAIFVIDEGTKQATKLDENDMAIFVAAHRQFTFLKAHYHGALRKDPNITWNYSKLP